MTLKFYEYPKCSTCRKARKWLDANGHEGAYETTHLVEQTPSREVLEALWERSGLDLKKFFNTRGGKYRELDLKNRYDELSDDERLDLLASDGMLIRRPLLDAGDDGVLVGFRQAQWADLLGG